MTRLDVFHTEDFRALGLFACSNHAGAECSGKLARSSDASECERTLICSSLRTRTACHRISTLENTGSAQAELRHSRPFWVSEHRN